jgi:hypothetical protein
LQQISAERMTSPETAPSASEIARRIIFARGQRVLLDTDLAQLYGVTIKRVNQLKRQT